MVLAPADRKGAPSLHAARCVLPEPRVGAGCVRQRCVLHFTRGSLHGVRRAVVRCIVVRCIVARGTPSVASSSRCIVAGRTPRAMCGIRPLSQASSACACTATRATARSRRPSSPVRLAAPSNR